MAQRKYDVADYLDSDEMIAVYLDAAFESGDTSRIAEALGDVARARDDQDSQGYRFSAGTALQNVER